MAMSFAPNHRCSVTLYLHDPEGNLLEVLGATRDHDRRAVHRAASPRGSRFEAYLRDLLGVPA